MNFLKRILPYFVISIIFTTVVVKYFLLVDECTTRIALHKKSIEIIDSKYYSLLNTEYLRIENEGLPFNSDILLLGDNNDSIIFEELIHQNTKLLIFRYSELNCMACVDKEVLNLKEFMKETDLRIIILASYLSMRDLYLFKRVNQIPDAEVYNIKDQQLGLPIEKNNIPYYFVTDTSFKAQIFFVPDKLIPERSIKYLKSIAN